MTVVSAEERSQQRPYHVLRHRDFRLLWAAEMLSTLGTQVQRVAIIWHVFRITGDPLQLGLLGLVRFLPILLFGLWGGVVADQRDRRRTLLVTQIALLTASTFLAVATTRDVFVLPTIYALTFASAAVTAIAGPTRQALIPALVPRSDLTGPVTLNIISSQVATVTGPLVAGLVIARFGVAVAYGLDAVSFLAVIAAVLAMGARPTVAPAVAGGIAAALDGLRFLRRAPVLLGVMTVDFLATFFGASTALLPVFAADVLGLDAQGLGLLYAAPAAGALVGSLLLGTLRPPSRPGAGVLGAVVIYGLASVGFGLSRTASAAVAALAVSGAADAASMAWRHALRSLATPDEYRGRVAAAHSTFAMGGPQLGEFEAGVTAALLGPVASVVIGGTGAALAAAAVALRTPSVLRYRADQEID